MLKMVMVSDDNDDDDDDDDDDDAYDDVYCYDDEAFERYL